MPRYDDGRDDQFVTECLKRDVIFCDVYARNMDILFNPAKTNCIFFPAYPTSLPGLPLHFMNTDIVFVSSCTFLGISVSSHDISDRNIPQSVQKLYRRSNEVMSDFKSLSRNVKS